VKIVAISSRAGTFAAKGAPITSFSEPAMMMTIDPMDV
jgi:hypothetical protein